MLLLDEESAVEQHPHHLHGVQRHAFGASQDLVPQLLWQPGDEPREELVHWLGSERLEGDGGEGPAARAPRRPPLEQLRARERHHVDRMIARPLEEVLDEIEQARVGPLHVLERQEDGIGVGEALEEESPGAEKLLLLACLVLLQSEQVRESGLDEAAVLLVEVLGERRAQLLERRRRLFVFGDAAPHPDHVRERPVGHALAVGETAAPVVERALRQAVDVLDELPGETRLADSADAGDRHEECPSFLGTGMEEVLQQAQLAVAPYERSLEPFGLERTTSARNDPERPPERDEPRLALHLVRSR